MTPIVIAADDGGTRVRDAAARKVVRGTLQRALDADMDPPEPVEAVAARYAEAAPRYGMGFLVD